MFSVNVLFQEIQEDILATYADVTAQFCYVLCWKLSAFFFWQTKNFYVHLHRLTYIATKNLCNLAWLQVRLRFFGSIQVLPWFTCCWCQQALSLWTLSQLYTSFHTFHKVSDVVATYLWTNSPRFLLKVKFSVGLCPVSPVKNNPLNFRRRQWHEHKNSCPAYEIGLFWAKYGQKAPLQ